MNVFVRACVCLRACSHVYARALTETYIHPRCTHQAYYGDLIDGVDVVHISDADKGGATLYFATRRSSGASTEIQ